VHHGLYSAKRMQYTRMYMMSLFACLRIAILHCGVLHIKNSQRSHLSSILFCPTFGYFFTYPIRYPEKVSCSQASSRPLHRHTHLPRHHVRHPAFIITNATSFRIQYTDATPTDLLILSASNTSSETRRYSTLSSSHLT